MPPIISISAPIGLYVTVHASYLIWRSRNKTLPKLETTQADENQSEHEINSNSSPSSEIAATPALEDIELEEVDEMQWFTKWFHCLSQKNSFYNLR